MLSLTARLLPVCRIRRLIPCFQTVRCKLYAAWLGFCFPPCAAELLVAGANLTSQGFIVDCSSAVTSAGAWYWQPWLQCATGPPWFQLVLGLDFKSRDMGACRGSIPPRGRYYTDLPLSSLRFIAKSTMAWLSKPIHDYFCFLIFLSSLLSSHLA